MYGMGRLDEGGVSSRMLGGPRQAWCQDVRMSGCQDSPSPLARAQQFVTNVVTWAGCTD